MTTLADYGGRMAEAVLADIEAARGILREQFPRLDPTWDRDEANECPHGVYLGGTPCGHCLGYADLRGRSISELPEAAAREGIPFLADQTDRDGRRKVVLMAVPQNSNLVQRFMAGEIVSGLTDFYGDPARGFAGGYYVL